MKSKLLFFILLGCASLLGTYFSLSFLIQVYNSSKLTEKSKTIDIKYFIVKRNEDAYLKGVKYFFTIKGRTYEGETILPKVYLNENAARRSLNTCKSDSYTVHYSPKNPRLSSLRIQLSWNDLLRACISWSVFVYFLIKIKTFYKEIIDS